MRYYWRVFLWEGGHKTEEYTKYTNAPIFLEDKLDETLDSGEIILMGMPIATKAAFPPKTKFRLERYAKRDFSDSPKTWDMIVEHDDVEEYTGCPDLCTHRVHLIEASAVAQGMHVDNIALTYELQDVDLNYETVESSTGKAPIVGEEGIGHYTPAFEYGGRDSNGKQGHTVNMAAGYHNFVGDNRSVTYYETAFKYEWENTQGLKDLSAENDCHSVHKFTVPIPKLIVKTGDGSSWIKVCEAPTKTFVSFVKYKQRARRRSDGKYEADPSYVSGRTVLAEETLTEVTSFPSDTSSFVSAEGRTVHEDNFLYAYSAYARRESYDCASGAGIAGLTAATWTSMSSRGAMSWCSPSSHYENVEFETIAMRDDEATETDAAGNVYVVWYEYTIRTRAAFYASGFTQPFTRQRYRATGYMPTAGANFNLIIEEVSREAINSDPRESVPSDLEISAKMVVGDLTVMRATSFLKRSAKYNCLALLRKALLTCDTRLLDEGGGLDEIQYPIIIGSDLADRLRQQTVYETMFEQKNLWEVLIQIGYYLHAIPYLEFATDGTDRFALNFRQLGGRETRADTNTKITVFNSRNLSEFFAQYDSYVTNLFSPQNVVEEWLVPKASDNSYLAKDDNAELQTKYGISEIVEFKLSYNGCPLADAINHVFEQSVYSCLSVAQDMRPSKACALYYNFGSDKIQGLTYTPPEVNNGDAPTAIKKLVEWVLGIDTKDLIYNNLMFYIKYRTQDTARVTQFRPSLQDFVKNSSFEQYPHHEQFYGQQDKIIDSERFSANLFGRLIRVGNAVYQRQELVRNDEDEKESGDLVSLGGEAYYVTATENEYYPDAILQKVTYSKNFNQLSNIVTIPSEPRFYEVSERSTVRREVRLNEFLKLSTAANASAQPPTFISGDWHGFVREIIFGDSGSVPNFAYTKFMADVERHGASRASTLFPSSKVSWEERERAYIPHVGKSYSDCIVPVLHFPMKNSIVFEWDMEDNFSAGSCVDTTTSGANKTTEDAYYAVQAVRYCDLYGRADLFQFKLFQQEDWKIEAARRLPYAEIEEFPKVHIASPSGVAVGLDKDNREALSFNYQINLLHEGNFVTYANLFGQKSGEIRACLLRHEVSMFEGTVSIYGDNLISDGIVPIFRQSGNNLVIEFPYSGDTSNVEAVVIYENSGTDKFPIVGRNIKKGEPVLTPWYIYPVFQAQKDS